MNAVAFDTHRYVKRLVASGMPEAQAEVIASEQRDLIEDQIATKQDLKELGVHLEQKIREMELRQEQKIREMELRQEQKIREMELRQEQKTLQMEQRLTLRLGAMTVAGIAVVGTLITTLVKIL